MTDESKPRTIIAGPCTCIHVSCAHPRGECPEMPVMVEDQLGTSSALCKACAEQWNTND